MSQGVSIKSRGGDATSKFRVLAPRKKASKNPSTESPPAQWTLTSPPTTTAEKNGSGSVASSTGDERAEQ